MQPRERYECEGPRRFGDVELLALVLGTGTATTSALEIGAGLLHDFGGLAQLARSEPTQLARQHGVGIARAVRLHAALELGQRARRVAPLDAPIRTAEEAWYALAPGLMHLDHEQLHGLYLDRRNRPLARRVLTVGSDGYTVVDPKQVFRPAIQLGACGVILAHNHPSGDPTPSPQDHEVTRRVRRAGEVIGIRLVDHLVIGQESYDTVP